VAIPTALHATTLSPAAPARSTSLRSLLRKTFDARRDDLWDALEWICMPVFILYPHLAVLKWYRYGALARA
jgi:hypothetical protein